QHLREPSMSSSISIDARAMPSVVFSPPASFGCTGRKPSGMIQPQTRPSVSACAAPRRRVLCKLFTWGGRRMSAAMERRHPMQSKGPGPALGPGARIVIAGASLAGLTAAEPLRAEGFTGSLTIVGEDPCLPYARPPLSKAVLSGQVPADH